MTYQPPFTLSPQILERIAAIGEDVGRFTALTDLESASHLRRENRIKTIQASLAIENNTLSLAQVTAVIEGRRVLGDPREILEVRNAFNAYEAMETWSPDAEMDLLEAHRHLMTGLIDDAGVYRRGGVGIYRGEHLVHMAPPAERVPFLIRDLLSWLRATDVHPLAASCVFHYEFAFIHPFADGNGRMARLWQTLILRQWRVELAYLPVETLVRDQQAEYYQALMASDRQGEATPFMIFMLDVLHNALQTSDQVGDQVSDQVAKLLTCLTDDLKSGADLMDELGLKHRPTFRKNYLDPALAAGLVERTYPNAPRSPKQRYRLTAKGRRFLA